MKPAEDPGKNEEEEKPRKVGKRQIIERLYAILRTADLEVRHVSDGVSLKLASLHTHACLALMLHLVHH